MRKICLFLFVLFCGFTSHAQENESVQDTTKTGYSKGKIEIQDPKSVLKLYVYDPVSDMYKYTSTVDGFPTDYPAILSPKEYEELARKESMRNYFKQKLDAIEGKKDGSESDKKDLLPMFYVKSGLFESLFGSNTIDIKPTGSVSMDLGVLYSKIDNPSLSTSNRTSTAFDFDQKISLSLTGKVGTRLNVNFNYDTESTFDFQNLIKLEFTPEEDDIVQKVEFGNVSFPLNSSLITGAQDLFGVKFQLKFGKTTVTGVFSQQKSETTTVVAETSGAVQEFELSGLDYDENRHYFLSQYFRNQYDTALADYPYVNSKINISRIEVWVTNKQSSVSSTTSTLRNIVALQDLGEAQLTGLSDDDVVVSSSSADMFLNATDSTPDDSNNKYDPDLISDGTGYLNSNIREIATSGSGFNVTVTEGTDYVKLENARKLSSTEYTYNAELGYISLQSKLSSDEVLAVAYQYSVGSTVYQVGEFSDSVDATVVTTSTDEDTDDTVTTQCLVLKMLKGTLTNTSDPVWNLMMKNIYSLSAYGLTEDSFTFNILYSNGSSLNYISPVSGVSFPSNPTSGNEVSETPLLRVFDFDQLDTNDDTQEGGDGLFDYVEGITMDSDNGKIIFTTKEPFGETLFNKLDTGSGEDYSDTSTYNANQTQYVYSQMYSKTKTQALQYSERNKFVLKGEYTSSSSDGISTGSTNISSGSVVVTTDGRTLVEGLDYSVNYTTGKVYILDAALLASSSSISVTVESNSTFGQQTKNYYGINVEHQFSDKFMIGGTFIKYVEKPLTEKTSYGQELVNNNMFGLYGNYATEAPFLTRLVNKLPNIDTDVPSNVSFRGEVAYLQPQDSNDSTFSDEDVSTVYVDDFEDAQSSIDLGTPSSWSLSSTPLNDSESSYDFNATASDLSYGYNRAKLSWYSIDSSFYTSSPSGISNSDLSLNSTRRIYYEELYTLDDDADEQTTVVTTMDLTYYPTERGPFNNSLDVDSDPESNFGGIMRSMTSTNFEQGNVQYIQFWLLDPYEGTGSTGSSNVGKIYFDLGEISEDILKDGRKQYENGLGPDEILVSPRPIWGDVPSTQSLVYTFDTDETNRTNEDIGLDGLSDTDEGEIYTNYASESDPAGDNYTYFFNTTGGVLDRYKNYNGTDGNSEIDSDADNAASTSTPDVEDINKDNTMDTTNAYFEYSIDLKPDLAEGDGYVNDVKETQVTMLDGTVTTARWIQFKIPISDPENTIGSISDFTSIRFMRMFLTGFSDEVTVRFGSLDLVRGAWTKYTLSLDADDTDQDDDGTTTEVSTVNVDENSDKCPINYILPPGVEQESYYSNNTLVTDDEQSLTMTITGSGLEPGDSRAAYKAVSLDMRQYKNLKMFLHAESIDGETALSDDQMSAFIRLGSDYTENFYQIEIPLKVTSPNSCASLDDDVVWPDENQIDLALSLLTSLKVEAKSADESLFTSDGIYFKDEDELDSSLSSKTNKLTLGVKGSPSLSSIKTIMLGVKNNETNQYLQGEVWFDELRMSDMDNQGGMAALFNLDANIADFATISGTYKKSTIGFGSITDSSSERNDSDTKQYNVLANLNLGKLLPPKLKINLPFNFSISQEVSTPEYDPFNDDIKLQDVLKNTSDDSTRDYYLNRAVDFTKNKSINFIGVRKEKNEEKKPHVYDIENFTLSHSYNEQVKHDDEILDYEKQVASSSVDYSYTLKPESITPFKNSKFLKKSSYWKMLSDFNFNYLPSTITFNTKINRSFILNQYRVDDEDSDGLDPTYSRTFEVSYNYGFNYNFSKALKLTYAASSENIVKNYLNDDDEQIADFSIWNDYFNVGTPDTHQQQVVMNYELPINKIPLFSFAKANFSYTGASGWTRSSTSEASITVDDVYYNLGNTIDNSNAQNLTATFTMDTFYKYIGLIKSKQKKTVEKPVAPKPGEKISKAKPVKQKTTKSNVFLDALKGILTSVKDVQVSYTKNSSTELPGFTPNIGYFGTVKPTVGFIFGLQNDIRDLSASKGWLTSYTDYTENFTQTVSKTLKITSNVELFKDVKIDLSLSRSYSENFTEEYEITNRKYSALSPTSYGAFSVSTALIKTSFLKSDVNSSTAFNDFRNNRIIIARRLAANNKYYTGDFDTDGYPSGYGSTNQAVLLPAFLAAYTGTDASNVSLGMFRNFPIPNWNVKYSGLMNYDFFKSNFKKFSLQHNYSATYAISSFTSNSDYDSDPDGTDSNDNFYNEYSLSSITLVEQFSPLLKMDVELKNTLKVLAEIKKNRSLTLSFDNELMTEVSAMEYIVGLGFRIKDVTFSSKLADNPTGVIKSDVVLKADVSYKKSQTIVRYLDYDDNELTAGKDVWSLKLTADYSLSKNLTATFYYNHSFSDAVVSTSYPLTSISSGFTILYSFGN